MSAAPSPWIRRAERLLAACCGLFLVVWCLREDVQPDFYFHLAAGRWILEHGLPHTNVFLAPYPDHAFTDHEWLFQVACYPLFQLGGAALLNLLKTATVATTFLLVAAACKRHGSLLRWLVIAAAVIVSGSRFILRPEVFSFLGVAAHIYFLTAERGKLTKRTIITLGVLQLLWGNSHGFSVFGPLLVGAALTGALAHGAIARWTRHTPPPPGRVKSLALLLAVEALAGLCNPYGLEATLYPFMILGRASQDTASAGLSYRVVELTSPFAPNLSGLPEIQLYKGWLLAAIPLYALALARGRARLAEGLMGAGLVAASLLYLRNLPLAALGLAVPTAAGLAALGDLVRARAPRGPWARTRAAIAGAGCVTLLVLTGTVLDDRWHQNASYDARAGLGLGSFPRYEATTAFLTDRPPPGELFNNFGMGHYLIWARDGAHPLPSMCGNTDLYPRSALRDYHELVSGQRSLAEDLAEGEVSDIVLDHRVEVEGGVLRELVKDERWVVVHADAHAIVFRSARFDPTPLDAAQLARDAQDWTFQDEEPDRFGPSAFLRTLRLLPERAVQPLGRLNAARLLELLGQRDASLTLIKEAEELAPDSPLVLRALAEWEEAYGQPRPLWERLCEAMPHDALPRVKLGLMELRKGPPGAKEAVSWFKRAQAIDPDSRLAAENLLTAYEMLEDPVELRRALAKTQDLRESKRAYYQGSAAMMEGDLERAEEAFARAVDADPRLTPAVALLAQVLGQRGKLPEAEEAWARLCALAPADASAWRALGAIRRVQDDKEGALAAWHRAAEVDPAEVRALLDGAALLLADRQASTALTWIRRALERNPRHPRALKLYEQATLEDQD